VELVERATHNAQEIAIEDVVSTLKQNIKAALEN